MPVSTMPFFKPDENMQTHRKAPALKESELFQQTDAIQHSLNRCDFKNRYDPVFSYRFHYRLKINGTLSESKMGIFRSIVVMEVIMGGGKSEKFC